MKPMVYQLSLGLLSVVVMTGCTPTQKQVPTHTHQAIFNGRDVGADERLARTVVAIHSVYPGADEGTICSGTLVSNSLVVTAAHCLVDTGTVRTILFGPDASHVQHRRKVLRQVVHPGWSEIEQIYSMPEEERSSDDSLKLVDSTWNDVALLQFEGDTPEGFEASPLLTDTTKVQTQTNLIAAGFGVSDPKNQKGAGRLRRTEIKIHNLQFRTNEFSVIQDESGTCDGDSGGPLFLQDGETLYLVGITSHGINDDFCRGTTVFSFLPNHLEWFRSQIEELNR